MWTPNPSAWSRSNGHLCAWLLAILVMLPAGGCNSSTSEDAPTVSQGQQASSSDTHGESSIAADNGARESATTGERPNVVLISVDTLRADHLGCYGYDRPTSPALDRLANQGAVFDDASATSPWTLPSHASLLTGLFPRHHGLLYYRPISRISDFTLADLLAAQGYETAAFVNSMFLDRPYGFANGFDRFEYLREDTKSKMPSGIFAEARQWLTRRRARPFFLFVHAYDVHSDYRSLPKYEQQFVGEYDGAVDGGTVQMALLAREGQLDDDDVAHLVDLYDAGIRQFDDELERFLEQLQAEFEHTAIIVTSDHGEEFMDHGNVLHGRAHFQEVIRVPLVIRAPGIPPGTRIAEPVSIVDVVPTVLGLLGIEPPGNLDGLDLGQTWRSPAWTPPSRFLFSEADHGTQRDGVQLNGIKWTVRHDNFKMHYDRPTGRTELFDLASDPHERVDVAGQETAAFMRLKDQLDRYLAGSRERPTSQPLSDEERRRLKTLGYAN